MILVIGDGYRFSSDVFTLKIPGKPAAPKQPRTSSALTAWSHLFGLIALSCKTHVELRTKTRSFVLQTIHLQEERDTHELQEK